MPIWTLQTAGERRQQQKHAGLVLCMSLTTSAVARRDETQQRRGRQGAQMLYIVDLYLSELFAMITQRPTRVGL